MSAAKGTNVDTSGKNSRVVAAHALLHVMAKKRSLDSFFEKDWQFLALSSEDRAFVYILVTGVLRHFFPLKQIIEEALHSPLPIKRGLTFEILLLGATQLLLLQTPPYAAVNTAVTLAQQDEKTAPFAKLINAVLRKISKNLSSLSERVSRETSLPDWLKDKWFLNYGEKMVAQIAIAVKKPPDRDLNIKKNTYFDAEHLGGKRLPTGGIRLNNGSGRIEEIPGYAEGTWWVQDFAATLPALLLLSALDKEGVILDACAAPGGKTAQLCLSPHKITALDRSSARMTVLEKNLTRLNLQADLVCSDLKTWDSKVCFDGILLDAPCSATGTLRRHPDLAFIKTPKDITALAQEQKRLLQKSASLLKKNGVLVYSTCSLEPEEGEEQIANFLNSTQGCAFSRIPIPLEHFPFLSSFVTSSGDIRTFPHSGCEDFIGMDGFFIALLKRNR